MPCSYRIATKKTGREFSIDLIHRPNLSERKVVFRLELGIVTFYKRPIDRHEVLNEAKMHFPVCSNSNFVWMPDGDALCNV